MKTFTKIFLAAAMAVVYFSGYGANPAFDVNNEGVYIPKTPNLANGDMTIWAGKPALWLPGISYKPVLDWGGYNKAFSKSLTMPKRSFTGFTANSSQSSMLGVSLLTASYKFDEGRLKATLNAYPNPSKGKFTISLSQASGATYKITLSNTIGHVIKVIEVHPDYHSYIIDLSDKPAGVYFYSLSVNDKLVETKRLILQQ